VEWVKDRGVQPFAKRESKASGVGTTNQLGCG
jgi:hypothetical protein